MARICICHRIPSIAWHLDTCPKHVAIDLTEGENHFLVGLLKYWIEHEVQSTSGVSYRILKKLEPRKCNCHRGDEI